MKLITNLSVVNITSTLAAEFDSLGSAKVLVVAETSSITSIDPEILKVGRFELQVETTIPDTQSRKQILRLISGLPKDATSTNLDAIGNRTHGFVGADLSRLLRSAWRIARSRMSMALNGYQDNENGDSETDLIIQVDEQDLSDALRRTRPSALREVFLETPNVRWGDIGGQQHVKKTLRQAIELPFKVITFALYDGASWLTECSLLKD